MQTTNKMQQPFSFINLFKSGQHVSGDKFAHPQEHFLTLYTASGTRHRLSCRPAPQFYLNCRQQCRCIVPEAVYTVKKCSWGWANLRPETCWADLKRLINEKVLASCWLFISLYWWCTLTQTSSSHTRTHTRTRARALVRESFRTAEMFQNSSGYSKSQCYFVRCLFHYVVTTSECATPVNVLERISKWPRCDLGNIPAFAWKDTRK